MKPAWMMPIAAISAISALLSLAGPAWAAVDIRLFVGRGGWTLERFESDVVILRTSVTAPGSRRPGLLLLSCAGAERRLSLRLPEGARIDAGAFRSVLIRVSGRPTSDQTTLLAGFKLEQGHILTLLETSPGPAGIVARLAGMLRARPARLDMLTHSGTGAIGLQALTPYVLSLGFGENDGVALDNFASACGLADR